MAISKEGERRGKGKRGRRKRKEDRGRKKEKAAGRKDRGMRKEEELGKEERAREKTLLRLPGSVNKQASKSGPRPTGPS